MSPPAIRPGTPALGASSVAVATIPAAGAVTQTVPDVKVIDDHLAVQAIIRAYQVRLDFSLLWLIFSAGVCCIACNAKRYNSNSKFIYWLTLRECSLSSIFISAV